MAVERITDLADAGSVTPADLVEISRLSPAVTISGATISAAAADNSFGDSGAGFLAAGFAVGNRVRVQGFATGGNNLFVGVVTAVAADKLTIGGTDGDGIADEVAGASVTISKWESRRVSLGGISSPYLVPLAFEEGPLANEVMLRHVFATKVAFADDFAGSVYAVGVNPTINPFVLDVQKNGASIGSISIASTGVLTLSTTGGAVQFDVGDLLTVVGPASPDGTLAEVAITLKGTRQ